MRSSTPDPFVPEDADGRTTTSSHSSSSPRHKRTRAWRAPATLVDAVSMGAPQSPVEGAGTLAGVRRISPSAVRTPTIRCSPAVERSPTATARSTLPSGSLKLTKAGMGRYAASSPDSRAAPRTSSSLSLSTAHPNSSSNGGRCHAA